MADLIKVAEWSGQCRANVIFVHGLDGHPYDTWRRGRGDDPAADPTFWPLWLAKDIEGLGVYTLGYAASASGWKAEDMPMEDRVSNVVSRLLSAPELRLSPLTIICHSLGGLIVKQVLLQLNEQKATNEASAQLLNCVRQVVFMGTPHSGATGATWMDKLRLLIWPSALTVALAAEAPTLRRINNSYRTLSAERGMSLAHRVFFETQSTALGKIVKEGSADPGLSSQAIPLDGNHFTIVKPRDRDSLAYVEIRNSIVASYPPVGQPGQLVLAHLPPFVPERSANLLGKALRIAVLLLVGGILYLAGSALWGPEPRSGPRAVDELTMAATLVAISNDGERVRVARLLYHRELTADEITIVREMRSGFDSPPVLPPRTEQAILQATTPDELRQVISTINLKPCGGSFEFRVDGASLVCANGQKIPALKATGVGSSLQSRDALIFHATEGGPTEGALRFFASAGARGSVHVLIAHSGAVVQLVPLDRQAWHVGRSEWKERGIQNLNAHSIGISLSNVGRLTKNLDGTFSGPGVKSVPANRVTTITSEGAETYWETFTDEQIKASQGIVRAFRSLYPNIGVLQHSDITPGKIDPGPAFPIDRLR